MHTLKHEGNSPRTIKDTGRKLLDTLKAAPDRLIERFKQMRYTMAVGTVAFGVAACVFSPPPAKKCENDGAPCTRPDIAMVQDAAQEGEDKPIIRDDRGLDSGHEDVVVPPLPDRPPLDTGREDAHPPDARRDTGLIKDAEARDGEETAESGPTDVDGGVAPDRVIIDAHADARTDAQERDADTQDGEEIPETGADAETNADADGGVAPDREESEVGPEPNVETDGGVEPNTAEAGPDAGAQEREIDAGNEQEAGPDAGREDATRQDTGAPDTGVRPWTQPDFARCRNITITGGHPIHYTHEAVIPAPLPNAQSDLRDIRFFEGTCTSTATGQVLPMVARTINVSGSSRILFKTITANVPNVAMFYGNVNAPNIFNPHGVFIAYSRGNDLSEFTQVNTRGGFTVTSNGITYSDYPWGNGMPGAQSYVFKDVQSLGGLTGFVLDITGIYNTQQEGTRPYVAFGVSDTLDFDMLTHTNVVAISRRDVSALKVFVLRSGVNGVQDFLNFSAQVGLAIPQPGVPYYIRLRNTETQVTAAYYASVQDREQETNALFTVVSNIALGPTRYIYHLFGLDVFNSTRTASGDFNDLSARKLVVPEPVVAVEPTVYPRPF